MKKFNPSEEVDFVIDRLRRRRRRDGQAAGDQAGFSVVVMEQGAWGAYGHEQDYNKDELINRFPSPEDDRLLVRSQDAAQHLPPQCE